MSKTRKMPFAKKFNTKQFLIAGLVVGALGGGMGWRLSASHAINSLTWTTVAATPSNKIDATGSYLNGKLYVFSGYTKVNPLAYNNTINIYDPSTNTWSVSKTRTPYPFTHVGSAHDSQYIYLAGGFIQDPSRPCGTYDPCEIFGTTNVWRFDPTAPTNSQFTALPSLPAARGSGDLVLVGRVLHFITGTNTGTVTAPYYGADRTEQLDHWTLDLDNLAAGWQANVPIPAGTGRTHGGAVVVGSDIYLIGGQTGHGNQCSSKNPSPCITLTDSVIRFDTSNPLAGWQTMAPLPAQRSHTAQTAIVVNSSLGPQIMVASGDNPANHWTSTVWIYTPDSGAGGWSSSTSLPTGRYAAVMKLDEDTGAVYITGGSPGATSKETDMGAYLP